MTSKRKRATAIREPNGRPSRAGLQREFPPAQVKRLRDAALAGLRDPEWGTELGRLYLVGSITAAMYAAGKWWREMAARYMDAIGAFPVRSAGLEVGRGGTPADPDTPEGQRQARRDANAAESFRRTHHVLMTAGPLAEAVVRRVCDYDEGPCGMAELISLRNGLSALATEQQKNHQRAGD